MMTGIIEIENMEFYAFHGCYETERIVGNEFVVSVALRTDVEKAAMRDNIGDAVNYVEVYNVVAREMTVKSSLLEHVAARIISSIKERFPEVMEVTVKVSKKNPPIGGKTEKTSVTLHC